MTVLTDTVLTTVCPCCGKCCPLSTHVGDHIAVPKPNDVSVCGTCGGVAIWDAEMVLREAPAEFFASLSDEERGELVQVRAIIQRMKTGPVEVS